jgi:hypothetical protein
MPASPLLTVLRIGGLVAGLVYGHSRLAYLQGLEKQTEKARHDIEAAKVAAAAAAGVPVAVKAAHH